MLCFRFVEISLEKLRPCRENVDPTIVANNSSFPCAESDHRPLDSYLLHSTSRILQFVDLLACNGFMVPNLLNKFRYLLRHRLGNFLLDHILCGYLYFGTSLFSKCFSVSRDSTEFRSGVLERNCIEQTWNSAGQSFRT